MADYKKYNSDGRSSEDKALDKFAEMMIEKINTLQNDWKKPWFTEGTLSWPKNLSGREYNGMNALMLMMHCEKQGYKLPVFCTFDRVVGLNFTKNKQGSKQQVKDNNGEALPQVTILKGEKSFPVFITTFTVVDKETKERIKYDDYRQMSEERRKEYNVYPKLHVYNVFNVAQTNLQEARPELYKKLEEAAGLKRPMQHGDDFSFPAMDKMIKENEWICPIKPVYGDNAYYSISKNEIVIPEKQQFKDGESFYTNLGHEMAHSTGAEDQLARLKPASFGSAEYAREELVAELSAALVAQRYGMTKHLKEDSASYLKSWLDSLKESPEFIKTTLTDVKKASHMITQRIDAMQLKIDQERGYEAVQTQGKAPTMYYASVAYLQSTDATDRLDNLKNDGDYGTLLTEAKEYDQGEAPDLSKVNLSPTKYRGDDLVIEDEHYAVVYNPTVGGTYDVMRKVTAEDIKDNIIRYGLPEDATDDVKEVAKQMQKEEIVVQEEEQHYHRGR
ncbi:DUF1738 domain-containing protein [Prevotella sp. PINT]|jgi:Antirestriction protein|uniref:zincin-like metallopeptidase domain-containing protein n=1 Tax=Palleniella intestinalis TaxID=2736291 RepID=UPI001556E93C|nr:zincin-like metallopeptidase domain-containing protein [Palleniella intestinalis]NPD82966.1 DUF1738 domain-containing protein [Palleniella intestinalis]